MCTYDLGMKVPKDEFPNTSEVSERQKAWQHLNSTVSKSFLNLKVAYFNTLFHMYTYSNVSTSLSRTTYLKTMSIDFRDSNSTVDTPVKVAF